MHPLPEPRVCPCGAALVNPGRYTRLCAPCQGKTRRRKPIYPFTAAQDAALRAAYESPDRSALLDAMERREEIPRWALKKRAQRLGFARTKERPWSAVELEILARHAWKSPPRIQVLLKAAGFHRTVTGIAVKLKRERLTGGDGYSASALAELLGVDSHKVLRWIARKLLTAHRRGTERTEAQGGDMWYVVHAEARRFVLACPGEYNLGRVEKLWFLDLVSNGQVGVRAESEGTGDDTGLYS